MTELECLKLLEDAIMKARVEIEKERKKHTAGPKKNNNNRKVRIT